MFSEILANLSRKDAGIEFIHEYGIEYVSYRDLASLIRGSARHFRHEGLRKGDKVIIAVHTDLAHVVAFLSFISMGAIPVSVKAPRNMSKQYSRYLQNIAEKFGISYVYHSLPIPLGTSPLKAMLSTSDEPTEYHIDGRTADIAFVQFSSGSIREPKPIPVTNQALVSNLRQILQFDRRTTDSVFFNYMPLTHDMGLVGGLLSCLVAQNPLILTETRYFFMKPLRCMEYAYNRRATIMLMPDFVMRYLTRVFGRHHVVAKPLPLFVFYRNIYCGSEPIRAPTVIAFLRTVTPFGLEARALCFCYGLAEATLLVTAHHFKGVAESFDSSLTRMPVACVGQPIETIELKVDAKDGMLGSIRLRGDTVFMGYWYGRERPHNSWFDTGDVGYLLNDDLYVCGRDSERLLINGEVIYATDIEASIMETQGVRDCLVLPEQNGFHLLLVPSPRGGWASEKVSELIAREFGAVPTSVVLVKPNDMLRTTSGKPQRDATLTSLRERGINFSRASVDIL